MAEYIEREAALKAIAEDKIEMTPELIAIGRAIGTYTAEQAFDGINQACDRHIELIKTLSAADVQPMKWISVYDQLPDYNMVVLVTDGEDVGTGYRYALGETGFMGWAVPFADIEEDDVSYWMPLPKPPKDGETWM